MILPSVTDERSLISADMNRSHEDCRFKFCRIRQIGVAARIAEANVMAVLLQSSGRKSRQLSRVSFATGEKNKNTHL